MFTIFLVLLLGAVKVESEQIQCQIVPIKTENGLTGHCCLFTKDTLGNQKEDRFIEQILKSNIMNGRVKLTLKPLDKGVLDERQHQGTRVPPANDGIIFYEDSDHKIITDKLDNQNRPRPTEVYSPRPNKPVVPTTSGGSFPVFHKTTSKPSKSQHSGESNSSEDYSNSSEENSTIAVTSSANNSTNNNGTKVEIGNRVNIGSPKSCNDSSKKTNNGDCETPFG